jgi:hypothetical protein
MEKISKKVITVAATVIVVSAASMPKVTGSNKNSTVSRRPEVELIVQLHVSQHATDELAFIQDRSVGCFSGC